MAQMTALAVHSTPCILAQRVSAPRPAARQPVMAAVGRSGGQMGGRRFQQVDPRRGAPRMDACRPRGYRNQWGGMGVGPMGATWNVPSPDDIARMTSAAESIFSELENAFKPERGQRAARSGSSSWRREGDKAAGKEREGRRDADSMRVAVDTAETAEAYTFLADLPGIKKTEVKVQANQEERVLSISGERFAPEAQDGRRRRIERSFGAFYRTFKMPEDADLGKISAAFKDGVLAVTVKRTQPAVPEVTDVPIEDWTDAATWVEENSKGSLDAVSDVEAGPPDDKDADSVAEW